MFEALKSDPPSSIESERTFSVTGFYIYCKIQMQFSRSICIFQKEEQEEKDRIQKERLERIEKILAKAFCYK